MESQQSKCGRKEQEDRLGGLPNDLLHSILHNLPLEDAVSTSGISHQWETMWLNVIATSRTLDFTNRAFVRQALAQVTAMVSPCLKRHADQDVTLDTLRVAMDGTLGGAKAFGHDVIRWVADAMARGAREVEVDLTPVHGHGAARLDTDNEGFFLELPRRPVPGQELTGLRSLSLSHANITDEEVEAVLSSCLLLEFLSLRSCHLLASVRIVGDKLHFLDLVRLTRVRRSTHFEWRWMALSVLPKCSDMMSSAVRWVVDAVARGAKEVEVDLTPAHGHGAAQLDTDGEGFFVELPGDLFLARNSLVRLALDRFSIGAVPLSAAGLTGLRSLSLNHANVTDEEVEAVLSSCLLLEFLSLRSCHLLASVRIIGDKLRCLKLVNCLEVLELRVAAPSLESFVFYGDVVCLTDEDDDNDDNHIATVDLGTTPALRDAYLSHVGITELYFTDRETAAYSGFLSCLAHARTLTLCSVGLLKLAEDMSELNLGIDMTKVQELQLLMEFLGFADIQSIASLFLHNPLPLLDRLFIHILGDPSEEGREAAPLPGELKDDRDIFIYDNGIVLGQLKLIKVVNLQGTRLEIVLLAFLAKRAPALEQLVLVTAEEEKGGPGDELVKIIQGHVSALQKASPVLSITVCRSSEDQSPNPAHTRFYHELHWSGKA
ncbi:hypothetical protein EJB05_32227, partial [Eragrostis curvula]